MNTHEELELAGSLQSLGLTQYETRAYISLLSIGISDARNLCAQSGVPSSKIYSIMNKFKLLGLAEVQESKPAKFRPLEPSVGLSRLIASKEKEVISLRETLPLLQSQLDDIYSSKKDAKEKKTFFNLQFGMKDHIQKHLVHLASATSEIVSYFETTCLKGARIYGRDVKQQIVGNIISNSVKSRIVFGVDDRQLIDSFVKGLPESKNIEVRVTKLIHAPFHVIDSKSAITVIDNPLFKDGRIASVYVIDRNLAKELRVGYLTLWDSAKTI